MAIRVHDLTRELMSAGGLLAGAVEPVHLAATERRDADLQEYLPRAGLRLRQVNDRDFGVAEELQ
jgi:hypothetical protein